MDHSHNASGDEKATRLIGALAPDPADRPDARRALSQFKSRIETERRDGFTMFGLRFSKKVQRTLAVGLTVAALVGLLAIPQVRAFASGVLSLFRVQRFVMVPVSEERMNQIQQAMENNAGFGESETIKDGGEPEEVASLDEAADAVGFTPLHADSSFGKPQEIRVTHDAVTRYRPDVKAMRDVFRSMNLDQKLLPANIDGKPFDITVPGGVMATYGKKNNGIALVQMPSPTVKVPNGVNMQKLGEAMLQLLGMTPQEAARMSKNIDWTTTLVVPVPKGLNSVREVDVRGVTGLLYQGSPSSDVKEYSGADPDVKSKSAPEDEYTVNLVWQADGYLYSVMGRNATRVLAFAEGLH